MLTQKKRKRAALSSLSSLRRPNPAFLPGTVLGSQGLHGKEVENSSTKALFRAMDAFFLKLQNEKDPSSIQGRAEQNLLKVMCSAHQESRTFFILKKVPLCSQGEKNSN